MRLFNILRRIAYRSPAAARCVSFNQKSIYLSIYCPTERSSVFRIPLQHEFPPLLKTPVSNWETDPLVAGRGVRESAGRWSRHVCIKEATKQLVQIGSHRPEIYWETCRVLQIRMHAARLMARSRFIATFNVRASLKPNRCRTRALPFAFCSIGR